MHVHGTCHCGRIELEADVDPASVSACHCTDCQKFSGGPYRVSVPTQAADFRWLRATPAYYVKTADSGTRRRQLFCPNCASPIASTADADDPPLYVLRVGLLDERADLSPAKQIWCDSALAWSNDLSDVPTFARQAA